ncbi:AcrR family transcriptional regulator [Actinoplanes lutulentus]|uniref:TetR family transcriptional regulator n=1 Tax=Actinoplanes lutulentus TaxID=1287878 RepID=A0A327Z1N5_9ACTN|nr:TetR/AcrR family transcriptional regulator [Actinoplanes lutulentus]MBB2943392.1 AcrR family transcriptional regulator [Actinoplanes lutulentus]RAK28450.1 TetR family transcriptional regulator [Actinoplanes lutulentus]
MTTDSVAKPPVRRRMSSSRRYSQLLDVAERLFVEQGFGSVSMDDIARAADVTRPVVYNHFQTKEGAYIACVKRVYERYNDALGAAVDRAEGAVDRLRAGADFFFSTVEVDRDRWVLLFTSASVLRGEYASELASLRLQHIESIIVLLRAAAPGAPADLLEASGHAMSGVGERLGHWWLSRPDLSRSDIVDYYVKILLDGLGRWVETD